jgi:hypothetical protein
VPEHLAEALWSLAKVALRREQCSSARELAERALALVPAGSASRAPALVIVAKSQLCDRQPALAVAPAEEVLEQAGRVAPEIGAAARVALARALSGMGRERGRARSLAEEARATFASVGPSASPDLEAVTRYLERR